MQFAGYGSYPPLEGVKKILVIKLRHLGDVLLSTPVFAQLREQFPHAQIGAYIWKEALPILEGNPSIDHFILHDRTQKSRGQLRGLLHDWGLLKQVRNNSYDLVVHLTEGDRGALATWVSGARIKVGVDPKKRWKRAIFTHIIKGCANPRHTVEKDLDSLRRIGIFPPPKKRNLCFQVPKQTRKEVEQWMGNEPFALIHPLSRWKFKCLPPKLMAQVVDLLPMKVVLTGTSSEKHYIDSIIQYCHKDPINFAGQTNLKELGALMLRATGVITVDTVALHIASALQVPCVALFGPTSEENWGPWNNPKGCVVTKPLACRPCRLDGCGGSKMSDCLWTLSPQEVVDAFSRVSSSAGTVGPLLALNSLATNKTE